MNAFDKIMVYYNQLHEDSFIADKGFQICRMGREEYTTLSSTLENTKGRKLTISFIVRDDYPETVELMVMFFNKCSLEQLKVVGEKIVEQEHRNIEICKNKEGAAMVSKFTLDEPDEALRMMKTILAEVNEVVVFML